MTRRARLAGYGGAAALVAIGVVCVILISGGTGVVLAMAFIGVGLVVAVSLVFYEIGLSEDRELDREARARKRSARGGARRHPRAPRLARRRGQRRRLL